MWGGVSLLLIAATLWLFKPQRAGTGRRWFGKAKLAQTLNANGLDNRVQLPKVTQRSVAAVSWTQFFHILKFDVKAVFKSVPFTVMLLFALVNFFGAASQSDSMYGTVVYPVTNNMLGVMQATFNFMLLIIITFYAGELIFKERQVKIADVCDAMPVANWIPLAAKSAALLAVVLCFLTAGGVSGALV